MPWSKEPGRRSSSPLKRVRAMVMRQHNGICYLCGHGGADEVDHIIGVAQWRKEQRVGDVNHPSNLAPAHGTPCLTCGKTCHKDKTQSEAAEARWGARKRPVEPHPGLINHADAIEASKAASTQPRVPNKDIRYERARRQYREGEHPGII